MKSITYAGGTLVTGDAVAQALLDYITSVGQSESNVTIDIPVREASGEIATHTLVVGPAIQLDVSDVVGDTADDEASQYPVPDLPQTATLDRTEPPAEAERAARDFDEAVADIEENLEHGGFS